MCLSSLKVKNLSAKFGSPGKWPLISPSSVAGSVWKTAVFQGVSCYDIPWCSKQGFAPGTLMKTFLPGTVPLTSGRDMVLPLSPETCVARHCWAGCHLELENWEELVQSVPYVLSPPRLPWLPQGCMKISASENFSGQEPRNQILSEFSYSQGCISPEQRFQELLLNGKLSLSHTFGSCCFLGICPWKSCLFWNDISLVPLSLQSWNLYLKREKLIQTRMQRWGGLCLKSELRQGCHAQLQADKKIWNLSENSFLPKEKALKFDDCQ